MYDIPSIIKIARSMKRAIVYINYHYMIGLSEDYSTLSILEYESSIPRPFTAKINDIVTDDNKEKYSNANIGEWANEYIKLSDNLYINSWDEPTLYNIIMEKFNRINIWLSTPHIQKIHEVERLDQVEDFMKNVAKLKVDDGMTKYFFDGSYMSTNFNKLHPINASDKVNLNIYDLDPVSYLFEYIIDKKKYVIKEYIRYRKMIIMQRNV